MKIAKWHKTKKLNRPIIIKENENMSKYFSSSGQL